MNTSKHVDGIGLTLAQLAEAMDDCEAGIRKCINDALGLLLISRHLDDPKLARHLRSPGFQKEVARHRGFLDEDVTLQSLAYDLEIPEPVMTWAFFEARARLLLAQRKEAQQ